MENDTELLSATNEGLKRAADLIRAGEVVGMPTETVYGLAANAFDEKAIEKIFSAKGRPADNPLIVHINGLDMLEKLVLNPSDIVYTLAKRFWPGPLTMIMQKSSIVPNAVTAGLLTVAVRFPSHPVALSLIKMSGLPLAAPSANRSGSPSPTTAKHVYEDLQGRISAIIDGGDCRYGVESTVVLVKSNQVTLLRPGSITPSMLREAGVNVVMGCGVLEEIAQGVTPLSPGMKHRHYSPKTEIVMVEGGIDDFFRFVTSKVKSSPKRVGVLTFTGEEDRFTVPCITYGGAEDPEEQAKLLFSALRLIDTLGVEIVYARTPSQEGVGLAVYNRLIRSASFRRVDSMHSP